MPTGPDPKWRYFWRAGERPDPSQTKFAELNADPVIPQGIPEWCEVRCLFRERVCERAQHRFAWNLHGRTHAAGSLGCHS
eukprot:1191746-Prorocentrum_minimum.AAC.3